MAAAFAFRSSTNSGDLRLRSSFNLIEERVFGLERFFFRSSVKVEIVSGERNVARLSVNFSSRHFYVALKLAKGFRGHRA